MLHHRVYVVLLDDGSLYVGMTGLPIEERYANHKAGHRASRVVQKHGVRLAPEYYAQLDAMSYEDAEDMEAKLAEQLRAQGFVIRGGH